MAIHEDVKRERESQEDPEQSAEGPGTDASSEGASAPGESPDAPEATHEEEEAHDVAPVGVASPTQLGTRRYVYASYFVGAIAITFLVSKALEFGWLRLQAWKPAVGEPRDEIVMPASALIGAAAAVYYWRRTRARQLAEEVATEMSKVTWPTRTEVTNGTFVVIVTTVVSTVFFALMDKFWGFVTNLVYGGS